MMSFPEFAEANEWWDGELSDREAEKAYQNYLTKNGYRADKVNGGVFRFVQNAPTQNGFSIGLVQYRYYNGNEGFEVVRVSPKAGFVTLERSRDEAEARAHANRHWSADRGLAPRIQPVCVGPCL